MSLLRDRMVRRESWSVGRERRCVRIAVPTRPVAPVRMRCIVLPLRHMAARIAGEEGS
jgi:hypothetical protein